MLNQAHSDAAQDDARQNTGATALPQGGRRREPDIGKTLQTVLWSMAAVLVMFAAGAYLWSLFTAKSTAQPVAPTVQQPVVPTTPVQQGGNVLNTSSAGTSVMAQAGATGAPGTKQDVLPGPGSSTATSILTSEAIQAGYVHILGPAGKVGNNTTIICPTACKIPEPVINVTMPPVKVDLTVPTYQATTTQPTVPTTPTQPTMTSPPATPAPAPAVNPAPANPAPAPAPAKVTNVQQPPPTQVVVGYNCHGQPVYGPRQLSK